MVKKIFCILGLWLIVLSLQGQSKEEWVDSVFNTLDLDKKIGQLFMIKVSDERDHRDLENRVKNDYIGGVLFEKRSIQIQSTLTRKLQAESHVPLLTAWNTLDHLRERPDSILHYPGLHALGAIQDDSLITALGFQLGREMSLAGINMSFLKANTENEDSETQENFSQDRFILSQKLLALKKGFDQNRIAICALSFPVRGISVTNVQKGLPSVQLSVDSTEAYPFKILIRNGLTALMPASTDLPLFYSKKKTAVANLLTSSAITASFAGNWIRKNLHYEGVIFVNVEDMDRQSNGWRAGDAEVFAFQAGNDVLLTSENLGAVIRRMKRFLKKEPSYNNQLDKSVRKILSFKYDALYQRHQVISDQLIARLRTPEARILRESLYNESVTVVTNDQNLLPIKQLDARNFHLIIVGDSAKSLPFVNRMEKYAPMHVSFAKDDKPVPSINKNPLRESVIIPAFFPDTKAELVEKVLTEIKFNYADREVLICDFGSAPLKKFAHEFPSVITAYDDDQEMLLTVPQAIFGAIETNAKLPVRYGNIPTGTGKSTGKINRLGYSFPVAQGMHEKTLQKIESIAKEAIDIGGTPGCHVLVAKEGKIVYEKSFGHLTYEKQIPVTDKTIYDLASVTKVAATLQAVMFIYDKNLIDLNKKASVYLPELRNSNKKDFTLKDILTHQAGLWPFLPFWAQTMKDTTYLPEFYSRRLSRDYPYVVADRLFASKSMKDSLWTWIIKSKIREKAQRTPFDYRYSDMGFYILHHLSEKILNQPMEDFLQQNLYEPLGASRLGYLPLLRFPISEIAPTENDKLFRRSLLIGTVHDQGAAMHGGIAGHAGLFGTATDLAKLGQMLLQGGTYGGTLYYKEGTVKLFTQKQFENSRRGLGWDKPTIGDWNSPTSYYASPMTFGHTGFTGTCIWVDPQFNLVYIFLSNRVHPDMTNNKLLSANIRSRIQDVIYESIFNYRKTEGGDETAPPIMPTETFGRSQ